MGKSRFIPGAFVTMPIQTGGTFNPADSTSYFFGYNPTNAPTTTTGTFKLYPPSGARWAVRDVYVRLTSGGTATAETSVLALRKNATAGTDQTIVAALATPSATSTESLTQGITGFEIGAGEYFELKWTTPAWSDNADTVFFAGYVNLEAI